MSILKNIISASLFLLATSSTPVLATSLNISGTNITGINNLTTQNGTYNISFSSANSSNLMEPAIFNDSINLIFAIYTALYNGLTETQYNSYTLGDASKLPVNQENLALTGAYFQSGNTPTPGFVTYLVSSPTAYLQDVTGNFIYIDGLDNNTYDSYASSTNWVQANVNYANAVPEPEALFLLLSGILLLAGYAKTKDNTGPNNQ